MRRISAGKPRYPALHCQLTCRKLGRNLTTRNSFLYCFLGVFLLVLVVMASMSVFLAVLEYHPSH